jgi:hypothetical protein
LLTLQFLLTKPFFVADFRQSFQIISYSLVIPLVLFTKCNGNDQVKEDKIDRECRTYGAKRISYRILVGNPEGKRPLERPRRRWEDNIIMDLREINGVV